MLFSGTELSLAMQVLFVLLLCLVIGRTSAAPLLVAAQVVLYFQEPKSLHSLSSFGSMTFVFILLGLLMFFSRDQTLKRITQLSVIDIGRSLITGWNVDPQQPDLIVPPLKGSAVRGGILLAISVVVSSLILPELTPPGEVMRGQPSYETMKQRLAAAPALMTGLIAGMVAMSWLSWCKLTRNQASMYGRSTLLTQLYPDINLIVRHRLRWRRRNRNKPPANVGLEIEQALASKEKGQNDRAQIDETKKHRSFRLS
jgi:hypothetical protein